MMKEKIFFGLSVFLIFVSSAFSQKKTVISNKQSPSIALAKTSCDCKDAVTISISKSTKYGLTCPPSGHGNIMEIKTKSTSAKNVFEEEHNTAWYQLNIEHDGELVFDIIPQDSTNDYDFLLYKKDETDFCNDLLNNKISPLRGNLSKNNVKTNGSTGLSLVAKNNFSEKGAGDNYSHSILVKQGEKYMLILDNVKPNGKGHTIYFNYMLKINVQGTVLDFTKQPIATEVSLMDDKNNCITKTITDSKTGRYQLTATVKENNSYTAIYYNTDYFPETEYINTKNLISNEISFIADKTMAELKVGKTYNLTYHGDRSQGLILYEELSPLYSLRTLMQKKPTMKIRLDVHVDESENKWWEKRDWGNNADRPTLPKWRASNLKLTLQSLGVSMDRIEIKPTDKIIISNPKTEEDKKQNRVVTLTVLSK